MNLKPVLIFLLPIYATLSVASPNEYIRDYEYTADEFDTKYTSRIQAIDGVKQSLIEELGTYVQSVLNIHEDKKGNKSASHDAVTLTAGIISTDILKENWDRVVYYVKASMVADKNEVQHAIEALRNDYRLEESLRESQQELDQARQTIKDLQQQMQQQKNIETLAHLNSRYVEAAKDLEVEYQYQRAVKAIIENKFGEAFQLMLTLAEKNYPKAQSRLGHMYERGLGTEPDYTKAASWYLKAIESGHTTAYARLGFIYERGLGVRKDLNKAVRLYRLAAEQGNPHGQSRLGHLYLRGNGVKKDTARALKLFQQSVSTRKHGRGYAMLGYMSEKGIEVDQDYQKAAALYDKAAERGNAYGMARLAWMYAKGRGVDKDSDKAWQLSEQAAHYNNAFGLSVMGYLYEKGEGAFRDYEMAHDLYSQGAAQNSGFAMFRLANMYHKGIGVTDDRDEAIKWYRRSAEFGNDKAGKRLNKLLKN